MEDRSFFSIDENSGVLSFQAPPDYESPTDIDSNNTYKVEVSVIDSQGASDTQLINVSVLNINELPTLTSVATITGAEEDTFKEITYADLAGAADEADVDGDALSFRIDALSNGTLEKWNGSSWVAVNPGSTYLATGEKLRWKAAANAHGSIDAFTISAYDGTAVSDTPIRFKLLLWR